MASHHPPLSGFFQQGYLTTDLDHAISIYRGQLGVWDWLTFDSASMGSPTPMRVGLAWVGRVMIELIQPLAPISPVYDGLLPAQGFAIRFHHFGYLIESAKQWREAEAAMATNQFPIVVRRENTGTVDLFYADARTMLGHYLEYVFLQPSGRAFFETIPRND